MVAGTYASYIAWVVSLWMITSWRPGRGHASFAMWRELARFGFPLVLAMLGFRLRTAVEALVVGRVLSTSALGFFRYGQRIARIPQMGIIEVGANTTFPAFSRIAGDRKRFAAAYLRALHWSMVGAAACTGLMIAAGEPAVVVLFGEQWRGAGVALVAMSGLNIGSAISIVVQDAIKAHARTRLINWFTLADLFLGVGFLLVLIRPFGFVGASLYISLTSLTTAAIMLGLAQLVVTVPLRRVLTVLATPIPSLLVATVATWWLEHDLLRADSRGPILAVVLLAVDALVFCLVYLAVLTVFAQSTVVTIVRIVPVLIARFRRGAQTLGDPERVPGPDHPDTHTSRKNLAEADRAPDRVPDAIPPPQQTPIAQESQPSDGAAGQKGPAGFRRPPAAPAKRALPTGFRRPPAEPARAPLPSGVARLPVNLTDHSFTSRTPDPPLKGGQHDRDVVAAITAGDPAGIAMTYDRYAAALYGYSHWILHDSAVAAEALKDTFVIAAATIRNLSEPSNLCPWLFALARNECRRRIRPASAVRDRDTDAADEPGNATNAVSDAGDDLSDATVQFRAVGPLADAGDDLSDATVQFRAVGPLADAGDDLSDATVQFRAVGPLADAGDDLSDATVQFRAVGPLADAGDDLSDATVQFRAVGPLADAGDDLSDATVQFRAVGPLADAGDDLSDATVQFRAVGPLADAGDDLSDATVQFRAVGRSAAAADDLSDATVQFPVIGPLADPIMPFREIGQPTYSPGHVNDQAQAELRSLIHSILAGLKPREREVIELSFRHDLNDNDLAIVLGVSQARAHDLASRARGRLEEAFGVLRIAITGRDACSVLGELLANWDGQLTEQTRDLIVWHTGQCQICAHHRWGAMRPAAVLRLLPLAPLPQDLQEQVLSLCTSTA